jgi:hypothetical protein
MGRTACVARATGTLLAVVLAMGAGLAHGAPRPDFSRIRILAIAPFADEASLSRQIADWGATRLSELSARGRFQIVAAANVAIVMQRLGIAPGDLISPGRTVAVGQAVGADAVLTGRVTMFMQEREPVDIGTASLSHAYTRVDLDVRVFEVATRLNLFQETFICTMPTAFGLAAMDCVVRDVARVLTR